jgi:hypothetical protein
VAVLLAAAAVGLLALLPSLAEAVWEVPHLFLLGAVISFGVFTQRNSDADGRNKDSSLAWSARCHPDAPLVVIADHTAPSDDGADDDDNYYGLEEGAQETPLSLPVRRLMKPASAPASAAQESETAGGHARDGFGEETTDSRASPSSGFRAGTRAVPSPPPSALDDDDRGVSQPHERPLFRKVSTDWDVDAAADDGSSDEMTPVSSERSSVRADFAACASGYSDSDSDDGDGGGDGDGTPVDLKLAEKAEAAGGEEEVDRKADEFIAKFRQQIRLQRH